jgi:uncharacterized membrane protein
MEDAMIWTDFGPGSWMHFGPMAMLGLVAVCGLMMFFTMRSRHGGRGVDSAAQLLKERFARGEIDKAEFDKRRRALEA